MAVFAPAVYKTIVSECSTYNSGCLAKESYSLVIKLEADEGIISDYSEFDVIVVFLADEKIACFTLVERPYYLVLC